MNRKLVLVDADDRPLGESDRASCHRGDGILHRAFSLHVVNSDGGILIQRRAAPKQLWPGYWSNSCCSHPYVGDAIEEAVRRRTREELGIDVSPTFLYKFQYQARFGDAGSENELCSVFVARSDDIPDADPEEISEWRYLAAVELDSEIASDPETFTPWFRTQWSRLGRDFAEWF